MQKSPVQVQGTIYAMELSMQPASSWAAQTFFLPACNNAIRWSIFWLRRVGQGKSSIPFRINIKSAGFTFVERGQAT
jgi:hypothetical protein